MKNKSIILVMSLILGLSACDMDKLPYSAIDESIALETMQDFENMRVGIYTTFRTITTGNYLLAGELQTDCFNAVVGFSNTYGDMYRWTFEPSSGTITGIWQNYYIVIARSNFYITGALDFLEKAGEDVTEEDKALLRKYLGEVYFTRAFCYLKLAGAFCEDYDPATAENKMGLPLQLVYAPTSNSAMYPGRSSLKDTYQQIVDDLAEAKKLVDTEGEQSAKYITKDIVTALEARLALQMDNYDKAITASTSLIALDTYALIDTDNPDAYKDMWKHDTGTETLWQIFMSMNELGARQGVYFIGEVEESKDYLPSNDLLNLYDPEADIRFEAYFGEYHLTVSTGAEADIYFFNKYPGNENIGTDNKAKFVNQTKVFRLAEMYLIAAEAYAQKNDLINGSKYLNALKTSRIVGFEGGTYSSQLVLMNEIKDERLRELVCEGHRLTDLKRWKMGVKRTASQNPDLILFPGQETTEKLNKPADDYRMVWPIPKIEIDANPQIKQQQNPGY